MQLKEEKDGIGEDKGSNKDHSTIEKPTEQEYNYKYYEEYKRLHQNAYYLSLQIKELLQNRQQLWARLLKLEKKTEEFKDDIRGEPAERKKRSRRTAEQVERRFVCEVHRCLKSYGSEGSLQQHIKLKHPELYEQLQGKKLGKGGEEGEEIKENED